MLTAPHAGSTAAALLRLLALWLAAILLAQGVAAAVARGIGPLHRHHDAAAAMAAPRLLSHHALPTPHAHQHATGERHFHAAGDASVQHDAATDAAFDEASLALAAALALLALGLTRAATARSGRAVWHAAAAWARAAAPLFPPFRPPRLA